MWQADLPARGQPLWVKPFIWGKQLETLATLYIHAGWTRLPVVLSGLARARGNSRQNILQAGDQLEGSKPRANPAF